jgi:hypothetical protein
MYETVKLASTVIQAITLCLPHGHSIEHLPYAIHAHVESSVWSVVGAAHAVKVVVGGQNVVATIPFGLGVTGAGRLEFCTLLFTVTAAAAAAAARREAATATAAGRVASVEEKLEPVAVAADAWGVGQ